jgi:hypothetical protein
VLVFHSEQPWAAPVQGMHSFVFPWVLNPPSVFTIQITCGQIKKKPGIGAGLRFYSSQVGAKWLPAYRFIGMLKFPQQVKKLWKYTSEATDSLQWCHRCYHRPQLCCSPLHGVLGSDQLNKSMHKCVNGAAFYCNHDPKCIYVDGDGIKIPCRNLTEFPTEECKHVPNCHTVLPGQREPAAPEV